MGMEQSHDGGDGDDALGVEVGAGANAGADGEIGKCFHDLDLDQPLKDRRTSTTRRRPPAPRAREFITERLVNGGDSCVKTS
jgi:hypothetical protein